MKKLKFFGCVVIGVMTIASFLLANNSNQKKSNDLVMLNIEALDASAGGEMTCDKTNEEECVILIRIGYEVAIGRSVGFLKYTWW
ncbi:MAG: NVEALA domain-containing protein [Bacteroidales bacterium]|nr:NVEALA domain-containing protein [Bacteroidales bacterium]MDD4671243.1 NVEALA domain-containing protein [Bacteroidales bacterium]